MKHLLTEDRLIANLSFGKVWSSKYICQKVKFVGSETDIKYIRNCQTV